MTEENRERHNPALDGPVTDHEYDGIQEYDNPLPTWWRRTFWFSFWFSVAYYIHYQLTGNGASVAQSYEVDMQEYRALVASQSLGEEMTEQGLTTLMGDPALMKDARSLFLTRCLQCHADKGQGNIGPNLTDEYWIYGDGTLMNIYESVSQGRPLKGMPAWSRLLGPMEIGLVVAYVGSIRNTHVAGRPPQGRKVEAGALKATEEVAAPEAATQPATPPPTASPPVPATEAQ